MIHGKSDREGGIRRLNGTWSSAHSEVRLEGAKSPNFPLKKNERKSSKRSAKRAKGADLILIVKVGSEKKIVSQCAWGECVEIRRSPLCHMKLQWVRMCVVVL